MTEREDPGCRAAGAIAKLITKEGKSATLKLPSGEVSLISKNCSAIVRQVGNIGVNQKSLDRAGSKRWLGKRPVVRGVVMNPVDHPHGGGEGRAPIEAVPNMPLERSEVVRAVIVRTCKELKRDNGIIIRYDDNAAVVIDQEGNPKGTRIFDVRGRVVSWSSAGIYGFKGTRRGTSFAAQTAAGNVIRTIVDQGKKYHSGKISKGVANGSSGSPNIDGSKMAKPTLHAIVPRITTGKYIKDHWAMRALHNNYDPYL
ncbi:hypothetical protein BC332_02503 [Capsicum chinense]|nr:hypothetical protein BC332_02503 [Capsicum chinense]